MENHAIWHAGELFERDHSDYLTVTNVVRCPLLNNQHDQNWRDEVSRDLPNRFQQIHHCTSNMKLMKSQCSMHETYYRATIPKCLDSELILGSDELKPG